VLEPLGRQARHPRSVGVFLAMMVFTSLVGTLVLGGTLALTRWPKPAAHAIDPTINIAPLIVAQPRIETPLPIQVWPIDKLTPQQAWIRISDLPESASLSAGYTIGPSAWRVPLEGLPKLKLTVAKAEGAVSYNLSIALMSGDTVLTEVPSILAITQVLQIGRNHLSAASREPSVCKIACPSPTARAPSAAATASQPVANGQPPDTAFKLEDRRRARKFERIGDYNMENGNIAIARTFYWRAADMGSSLAAASLAATYDPNELVRWATIGVTAEPEAARSWYARARELANTEMQFYLQRLESPKVRGVETP